MERFDRNNHHHNDADDESHNSVYQLSRDTHFHTHVHYHFGVFNNNGSQPHEGVRTGSSAAASLINKPTCRVYTKANPGFCLTIRGGNNLVLAQVDPENEYQYWYRVDDYKSLVKDKDGSPAFSLVNKVTGDAIKHSIGDQHPVQLVPYSPLSFDESILWTESIQCFDGYRAFRMVNNVNHHLNAFIGGGKVEDGTAITMSHWHGGDNQKWSFFPAQS